RGVAGANDVDDVTSREHIARTLRFWSDAGVSRYPRPGNARPIDLRRASILEHNARSALGDIDDQGRLQHVDRGIFFQSRQELSRWCPRSDRYAGDWPAI